MLSKVHIRHTAIGGRIVLARAGKDPSVALETRDVMSEFWQALVSYAFDGKMPEPGAETEIKFGGGDEQFVLTVKRAGGPPEAAEARITDLQAEVGRKDEALARAEAALIAARQNMSRHGIPTQATEETLEDIRAVLTTKGDTDV